MTNNINLNIYIYRNVYLTMILHKIFLNNDIRFFFFLLDQYFIIFNYF